MKGTIPSQSQTAGLRGSCTANYASPEQINGGDPDPRDDVHALGVIWYQMLLGDLTRRAPSASGWKRKLTEGRGVPSAMIDLLESCFEEAAERPDHAGILAERLLGLIPARPSTSPPLPENEVREEPVGAARSGNGVVPHPTSRQENEIGDPRWDDPIKTNPSPAGYTNRGIAWREKKEYDCATADYTEAIRLDPKYAIAYNNRGLVWHDKKEYDRAIADYSEAIRLDPKYAIAYANRGNSWFAKKEYDRAIADYTEAIRLDPKHAPAYNNRGYTWEEKGDFDRAIADYEQALKIDPNHAYARPNLDRVLKARKPAKKGWFGT